MQCQFELASIYFLSKI